MDSLNAAENSEALTILGLEGGAAAVGLGGAYYAGGEVFDTAVSVGPEVWGNVYDFVGSFDPNPAAPFAVTVGGVAGWVASGGATEWLNSVEDAGNNLWNALTPP